jgi:PAS domain S-box-containing protein
VSRPVRVLMVEDSEDDAKLAIRMLRSGGFDPLYHRVQDMESFRRLLGQQPWDAVLSDFRLPGFNGVDALNIFRDCGQDIPFIFCSGTIGEEIAVAAMKAGASDYVMKGNLARLAPALERELAQAAIRAQHRQGQIDLEVSRDRYMDLYDFAPVGYLTLADDGRIAQLNLTAADMLGEPRERLIDTGFSRFVVPADRERWEQHLARTLERGKKCKIEIALTRAQGPHFQAQIDCLRVVDEHAGTVVRIAVTDITERKEAEADLRRFEAQLRHVQKMESIGTLAGGIAHDFNNILGAILGNAELAREEAVPGSMSEACLGEIRKAGLRARDLVQQILTFSRHEPQKLVTQPLQPIVEETQKLLRATLPTRVEFSVAMAEAPLHVHADATQIQQVLMNLCTNAWHALKNGEGRIGVGLDAVTLDETQCRRIAGLRVGLHVHVSVSDNGAGMDAATRDRIFEPFFTTKPVGQGTGLGLSVVHGIVTAHRGAIAVDTEPGLGTTFHLYLPAVEAGTQARPLGDAEARPPQGRGERVLYVDDDETMVLMVERLLQRAGYESRICLSALEAVETVRAHPEAFDLVVTDYNMPELSGLQVARALAELRPGMPVVISSGYLSDELRAEARQAGVQGLLEKQNTFEELCPLVERLLASAPARKG